MSTKTWLRDHVVPKWVHALYQKAYNRYIKTHPQYQASRIYEDFIGRKINWENPQEFSEIGRWLQFNSDTSRWSEMADKYLVRNFIYEKGFSENLPKLYGVWDNASKIDFASLPMSFVLKTNHGSGEIIVIKDKNKINEDDIKNKMNKYLHTPYGYESAEPHYLKISPRIVAEELLENTCPTSKTIVDYKIFCFLGEPFLINICYNRDSKTHHCIDAWYNTEWKLLDNYLAFGPKGIEFERPHSLSKMYEICHVLTKDFPFVRLDFYDVNGKPYIGEMTFTPSGFNGDSLTEEARMEIGKFLDLTKIPSKMLKNSLPKDYKPCTTHQ